MKLHLCTVAIGVLLLGTITAYAQLDRQPGPSVTGLGGAFYIPGTETILVLGYDAGDLAKRGVYRSTDEGETFTQVLQSDNPHTIYQNGADIYHVSSVLDAWRSDDDGETWTLMDPLPSGTLGDFEIASNGDMYSVVNGKVYASMDDGANWTLSNTGVPTGTYINDLEILKGASDVFVTQAFDAIYGSTDGANWTAANGLPSGATFSALFTMYMANYLLQQAVGCTDAIVTVSQDGDVYISTNGIDFTYVNTIPGLGVLSAYLVSVDPLQQGRVYAIVDNNGKIMFEWDFCEEDWEPSPTASWFTEGVAETTNNGTGAFLNPIFTRMFNFKTGADTTVGLLMTGQKIENGDTFRIFRTNVTLSDAVGIANVGSLLEGITAYPTLVASGQGFTLRNDGTALTAGLVITDLSGKEIANWNSLQLNNGENLVTLPTGLSTGNYLMRLTDQRTGRVSNQRLIVQR